MWFKKRNYKEEYRQVLSYLETKKEQIELIEGLNAYHEKCALDEKTLKLNGSMKAIIKFYFDDIKMCYQYLKSATDEQKEDYEKRIHANRLVISELEKIEPVYNEILYYENLKANLEKKLSQEERQEIKIEITRENESMKR